jgi:hypothetical protein
MPPDPLPVPIAPEPRLLTAAEFHRLADVPPEVEWFANLGNPHTRRAYEKATGDSYRRRAALGRKQKTAGRPPNYATTKDLGTVSLSDNQSPT